VSIQLCWQKKKKKIVCSTVVCNTQKNFWYVNKFKLKVILQIIKNVKNYLTIIYYRPVQCHSHRLPLQSSVSYLNKQNYIILQYVISSLLHKYRTHRKKRHKQPFEMAGRVTFQVILQGAFKH
jgi:hypothetical protein